MLFFHGRVTIKFHRNYSRNLLVERERERESMMMTRRRKNENEIFLEVRGKKVKTTNEEENERIIIKKFPLTHFRVYESHDCLVCNENY